MQWGFQFSAFSMIVFARPHPNLLSVTNECHTKQEFHLCAWCWHIIKEEMHQSVTEIKFFKFAMGPSLKPSFKQELSSYPATVVKDLDWKCVVHFIDLVNRKLELGMTSHKF